MADKYFTADYLRSILEYDQITGSFTWLALTSRRVKVGDVAGWKTSIGYIRINVLGRAYQAHCIAWLHFYGAWPTADIDHIDGNPSNNAIANLRDVSHSVNLQNQQRAQRCNNSGFLGVSRRGSCWRAQITADGKKRHIGTFNTPELAHAAYLEAKRKLHAGCTI